jgi:tetratricopeptide (TPR) repeat protein
MEAEFEEDLRLLKRTLRSEGFRFILIRHNRYSIYQDIAIWIRAQYPKRPVLELRISEEPNYRQFIDAIKTFGRGIILIPDFQMLFRDEDKFHDLRVAFNQRRDLLASLDIAFLCFVEPTGSLKIPKLLPDWWSLRSLEVVFLRDTSTSDEVATGTSVWADGIESNPDSSEVKEAEIARLKQQLAEANPDNRLLMRYLYGHLGILYFQLGNYGEALTYLQDSLTIYQQVRDKEGEGTILNNISQIYKARGDYETALTYLHESLRIRQQIGDKSGEGTTLNNISQIYDARGDYETALTYLHQSLRIQQQIGDKRGEGTTLNNISQIYDARGDYETALTYLHQSLRIQQQIGGVAGMATTLHNMGTLVYGQLKEYKQAITYLIQSYQIFTRLGSPNVRHPESYLATIFNEIGEERFNEIVREIEAEEPKPETP